MQVLAALQKIFPCQFLSTRASCLGLRCLTRHLLSDVSVSVSFRPNQCTPNPDGPLLSVENASQDITEKDVTLRRSLLHPRLRFEPDGITVSRQTCLLLGSLLYLFTPSVWCLLNYLAWLNCLDANSLKFGYTRCPIKPQVVCAPLATSLAQIRSALIGQLWFHKPGNLR